MLYLAPPTITTRLNGPLHCLHAFEQTVAEVDGGFPNRGPVGWGQIPAR